MRTPATQQNWERAGLEDMDGRLDRLFPSLGLFVPDKVDLVPKRDALVWARTSGTPANWRQPPDDLLTRFVRLRLSATGEQSDPDGEAVLRFARTYGPLNVPGETTALERAFLRSLPAPWKEGEPLEAWRDFTAGVCAVLDIASAVRDGKVPPRSAWGPFTANAPTTVKRAAEVLVRVVNGWIQESRATPLLVWPLPGDPGLIVDCPTLYGVLSMQLVQAIAGIEGWRLCKSCGARFTLDANRRGPRLRYCDRPSCGPKARRRLASARLYQKKKDEQRKKAQHGKASRSR